VNVDDLDALMGDPRDPGNPMGFDAVLAADERQEMLADGERLLDGYGFNAEFVPTRLGGRLDRIDRLATALRAVWRRDPCLGLGYGFSSFISGMNIWTAGDDEQQRGAAKLLLDNGKIAAAFHELDHGNDFAHAGFTARAVADGWLLSGRKEVVTNLRRADALVLFARTSSAAGSRAHSQFLIDELPGDAVRHLSRLRSSGMRGVQLGRAEFTDCPVPGGALLGELGQGMEIALRSYQVTRAVFPAVSVGPLDTALRLAAEFAHDRRLYGGVIADIPYVQAILARSFADLLAVDALSTVAVRSLHLLPAEMGVYAPATKYLTSRMVLDAFEDLRSVLGAQAFLRDGRYGMFQKLHRDIAPATFAHVSRSACQVMLLPQLPRLARRSWFADPAADPAVFAVDGPLPALDLDRLTAGMARTDSVIATLAQRSADASPLGRFVARFQGALRLLRAECTDLRPSDITIDGSPAAFALADRYSVVLAGAAALAVWGDRPDTALLGVLDRLDGRLGGDSVLTPAEREHVERHLFGEVARRLRENRLLDLSARRVPG
jgi:alkylation response protein AidB-like acyl-CoA dehydrogenase